MPIEVIAVFGTDGKPMPSKFKIVTNDGADVIKIDRIIEVDDTSFYCGPTFIYKCRSVIRGQERCYKIMYQINKCKW